MSRLLLDIPPGLVSDETTFSTPGRWADGNNVRFWRGRAEPLGFLAAAGNAIGTTVTYPTGTCRAILSYQMASASADSVVTYVFGTHSKLQAWTAASGTVDITPSGLTTGYTDDNGSGVYMRVWSLSNWGNAVIASVGGYLGAGEKAFYYWDGSTGTPATVIANAPAKANCSLVLPTQRMVLAGGCSEVTSGNYNPMCIRNCHAEDYNDWTPSGTNLADEVILAGDGKILAMRAIGQYIGVWTDKALYIGQYIGDEDEAFRFDLVASGCGIIGPNAVTIYQNTAYWLGADLRPWTWTQGSSPQHIPCPISREFLDAIDRDRACKTVVAAKSQYGEIWFYYTNQVAGTENNRAIFFNTTDLSWSKSDYAVTAALDNADVAGVFPRKAHMAVDVGYSLVMFHDYEEIAYPFSFRKAWYLTSSDFYLDDAKRWTLVRGCWPDFDDIVLASNGCLYLQVTTRDKPSSTPTTHFTAHQLEMGNNVTPAEKLDFLVSGRIMSFKLTGSWTDVPTIANFARVGRFSFDVVPQGEK